MTVIQGDCLEVMPTLEADSIDAIVCDPPYHLTTGKKGGSGEASVNLNSPYGRARIGTGFMGKAWDGGDVAFRSETWEAALRVAKPGAHLVAFGGTRTWHRLASAIEDAGWEIRDCLSYLYGSGFPKSLNVGCRCESQSQTERDVRPVRNADVSPPLDASGESGETLFAGVSESDISLIRTTWPEPESSGREESGVEGRGDVQEGEGELHRAEVRPLSGGVLADVAERRLRDGASVGDGKDARSLLDTDGGSAPPRPQHSKQQAGKPAILPGQQHSQARRMACEGCGGLTDRRGWGTALKPAWEPCILARKPLIGTVAANVQEYGTGALNIDACRIATDGEDMGDPRRFLASDQNLHDGWQRPHKADTAKMSERATERFDRTATLGRWPANVILDEEAAALLDEQSGERGGAAPASGPTHEGYNKSGSMAGHRNGMGERAPAFHADKGGASRFYYTAKASRSERDGGLYDIGLPQSDVQRDPDAPGGNNPRNRGARAVKNHHPTVKPISLMRWLVKLVTPPNGLILDPFTGSGSTGCAAVLENFRFVGIEREAEYCEIARSRIAHAESCFAPDLFEPLD